MDKQDSERKEEFKKHEMEKEHKRREHLNEMDEKARKEEELRYQKLQEKHHNASKNLHHPVSPACCRPCLVKVKVFFQEVKWSETRCELHKT